MSHPGDPSDVIPAGLQSVLQKTVSLKLYPHDLFPRQSFPDLDAIVSGLFREIWESHANFRIGLSAADETRAGEMIAAELSLPSILARHPRTLVMIYRQLISGFVRRLHRRQDERQDILQEIFVRLFSGKLAKIQNKFDANFKQMPSFTSYFMVCIRNMYVDIVREGRNLLMKRNDVPQEVLEMVVPSRAQTCQTAFLDEEFSKLRIILQLHASCREKIELALKLKFRFGVTAHDVRCCFPSCSTAEIQALSADFRNTRDRDMYQAIVPVFNRHEPKPVRPDTLRKWAESKTSLIVSHLNRLHQATVYDSENIADLLGLFFKEDDDHDKTQPLPL